MKILSNVLNGVLKIGAKQHKDSRGWFCEGYRQDAFQQLQIHNVFVQDNFSHTIKMGTIRGLHYQEEPYAQTKLFRCISGAVYDVVDLRQHSSTYLQWAGFVLSGDRFAISNRAAGGSTVRSDISLRWRGSICLSGFICT